MAGFDLVYALQDREFDRKERLFSFPAKFGEKATLRMATRLHVGAAGLLGLFGWMAGFGWRYGASWAAVCLVLWMESCWWKVEGDRWKAFFQANAVVSLLVLGGVVWEIFGR